MEERDKNDLGRFGLGLKTASLSQCRKLTVISKRDNEINAACWDLNYIIEQQDWSLQVYNNNEIRRIQFSDYLKNKKSGTIVIWQEFDRISDGSVNAEKAFDEKIERSQEHIALVFHRFMEGENFSKRLKIYFNNAVIEPIDPFLTTNPATQPLTEQTFRIEGSVIKVKPYILPFSSKVSAKEKKKLGELADLRSNQGFYVYRNKRLIIWGTWFRLIRSQELNKLARIRVDIPNTLDSIWEIDVKKSTASLPGIVKQNLINIVDNSVGRSKRVYEYRGRSVKNDDLQHIWKTIDNRGKFQYLINRDLPIYKLLENELDEKAFGYLDSFIKTIEDAFPYGDVYYRMASDETSVNQDGMSFEEVYKVAENMIASCKEMGESVQIFLASLDKIDYFMKYPDVIKKIREDYKNEQ